MDTIVPISAEALTAMRTLVRAGVSDEAIGRALRELLLCSAPDVLSVNTSTPAREAFAPSGPAIGNVQVSEETRPTATQPRPLKRSADIRSTKPVPLKVRFIDGKASNVTVPADLLHQVADKLGGDEQARQKVRELARNCPLSVENRSKWIQAGLLELTKQ